MYKSEITTLINENLTLSSAAANLIKDFSATGDIDSLERAEEIQEQMSQNFNRIERLRSEN